MTTTSELADIVGYYFGELDEHERTAVEAAMARDAELLREYFALKRHLEASVSSPDDAVRVRLEASVVEAFGRQARRRRAPLRVAIMAAALTASAAGIWWQVRSARHDADGQWVDTARTQPASGTIL